ncbi:RagB/SusD family nutrient uptake outer membrane protein [Dysgonomonas sp. 521]|uniref:RagB/SusD family nutrient uptake outer membrane protein n=1 Tax=Dysgonomonas sp. 521 TaxID=2302932 RepID=UPI0013D58337|nr:RagB/SusD family nutrient uptake outer membrane protein [Dysgonomonas sp. 521]NDV96380.1 RagB/SusD family nutrient uptake outer membrane protein [Dysgonomonas sp. 521]
MKKILIISLLGLLCFTACVDLDVPPKGLVTDEDLLTNDAGMDIYMARMYSKMPFEEFKYLGEWGFEFNSWLGSMGIEATGEALNRDGICKTFNKENTPYWGMAFEQLRLANYLIENLPDYRGNFTEETYNHYLGEAYYARAFTFTAMAKRFGGVPLVTKVIQYPADKETLEVPRASEEETWDQILEDYDQAIELMLPASPKSGYSNKYVALAFKAEAMLYAGSVARYNETVDQRLTGLGKKTGVRVMGFAEDRWQAAAKKYFEEAYKAANKVIADGKYELYKNKWEANNKEAQYQNMVDMFTDKNSKENIYVREYMYPTLTHGYDAYSQPLQFRTALSSGTCPTLDFLELFEGFDRYPNGTVKVTTGSSNTQGEYIMYDKPMDFFKDAEPRLRAYVIFPSDIFKGQEIEIRAGVYTGSTPVKPFFDDYSYSSAERTYSHLDIANSTPKTLYLSSTLEGQVTVKYDGKEITAAGKNGPFYSQGECAMTGMYGRKWLNSDPSFISGEGKSEQPFILIRYADVLLTAAEAAVELGRLGGISPDGSNMYDVATKAINDIRERAGVTEKVATLKGDEASRNIVRKERRKELAFEHKTKWDLRRWRVQHYENRGDFWGEKRDRSIFSGLDGYRFRGLYPFFSTQTGKYFFDARFQMVALKTFNYTPRDYYFEIPAGEVAKSPVIDQQPNR